jgi:molybdenum cofactor biosynthesis protein B
MGPSIDDARSDPFERLGHIVERALTEAGVTLVRHHVLRDELSFIREFIQQTAGQNEADAVIFFGGTGIGPRDQMPKALGPVLEKQIDGFAETFRRLYFEAVGARAAYSRVVAGTYNRCLVYALPADETAARLGVEKLILPMLELAVDLANGKVADG